MLALWSCSSKGPTSAVSSLTPPSHQLLAAPISPLVSKVILRVQLEYVEPKRLDPDVMLDGALTELSNSIPEIQSTIETAPEGRLISLTMDDEERQIPIVKLKDLSDVNLLFQSLLRYAKVHGFEENRFQKIEHAIIRGMLGKLDPHSTLLPEESYTDFRINTKGNFGGVGIRIGIRDNQVTVISPIDGTPAARAGILAKDKIVRIDDESTTNMTLTDTVNRLRGEVGSPVVLWIMRRGFAEAKKFTITRAVIRIDSVETVDLSRGDMNFRYLRLKSFQETTYQDLFSKLQSLDEVHGLILDLRNNPGGLLDQAVKVADLFLAEKKTIVSTRNSKNAQVYRSHWSLRDERLTQIPLVVLVNGGSASASEIVAAALKNNQRALVIGEQTFGKGSVQTVWPMQDDSGLKLTIAKYLTPGNKSIQSVGVTPDVLLYPTVISEQRMHLAEQNLIQKEEDLSFNFKEWAGEAEPPAITLPYLVPDEQEGEENASEDLKKRLQTDFFVELSRKVLVYHLQERLPNLLATAFSVYDSVLEVQDQRIVEALKEHDVDWKRENTPQPENLEVTIRLEQQESDSKKWLVVSDRVLAGAQVRFHVSVRNMGTTAVSRLFATTKSRNSIYANLELPFGYVAPGETKEWAVPVKVPEWMFNAINQVTFQFMDHTQQSLFSKNVFVNTSALPRPQFTFMLKSWDDGAFDSVGNGDGIIQVGETIALELQVKNVGNGISNQTTAVLKADGVQPSLTLSEGREEIGVLKKGEEKSTILRFSIKEGTPEVDFKMFVEIRDEMFQDRNLIYKIQSTGQLPESTHYESPLIEFEVLDEHQNAFRGVTDLDSVQLAGVVSDDQMVKDVFVFLNDKKIFFRSNKNPASHQSLPFDISLALNEGYNHITVFARDQHDIFARRDLQVWRVRKS